MSGQFISYAIEWFYSEGSETYFLRLSSSLLASSLLRDSQPDFVFSGESLKDGVEGFAVARADHRRGVGRLNDVRVSVADDHFGDHQIDHLIEQPAFENPQRNLQPRGRRRSARLEINEADAAAIFFEHLQDALLFAVGASAGADEHRRAFAPAQARIYEPGVVNLFGVVEFEEARDHANEVARAASVDITDHGNAGLLGRPQQFEHRVNMAPLRLSLKAVGEGDDERAVEERHRQLFGGLARLGGLT